jgi:hypothetical protein
MGELAGVVLLSAIGATAASVGAIAYRRRSGRDVPVRYIAATYGIFIVIGLVIALLPQALLGGVLAAIVGIDAVMWHAMRRRTPTGSLNSVERPEFWVIAASATLVLAVAAILLSSR